MCVPKSRSPAPGNDLPNDDNRTRSRAILWHNRTAAGHGGSSSPSQESAKLGSLTSRRDAVCFVSRGPPPQSRSPQWLGRRAGPLRSVPLSPRSAWRGSHRRARRY